MKFFVTVFSVLVFVSCTSVFKNGKSDTFLKDSDFLKQGNKVENIEEPPPKKKKETSSEKKEDKPKKVKKKEKNKNTQASKTQKTKKKEKDKKASTKKEKKSSPKSQKTAQNKDNKNENSDSGVEPMDSTFFPGEKVILSASYFGVEAGKITIGVDSIKKFNEEKVYHFYAFGKTSSVFSFFYGVRDKIESLWSIKKKKPLSLAFNVDESKQEYKTRTYFNWEKNEAKYFEEGWERDKGDYKGEETWDLPKSAQDIVSAIFFVRTLPLKVGESYTFNVMEQEEVIQATIKVDRKETLDTREGDFETLVLKPYFKTKGKFKKVGDISIWITDDHFRQVVRIETKIKIGTIVAKLYEIVRP